MTLEHIRQPDDGPQAVPHVPGIPTGEELLGAHGIHMPREPAKLLLDGQGPGRLQGVVPDGVKALPLSG